MLPVTSVHSNLSLSGPVCERVKHQKQTHENVYARYSLDELAVASLPKLMAICKTAAATACPVRDLTISTDCG